MYDRLPTTGFLVVKWSRVSTRSCFTCLLCCLRKELMIGSSPLKPTNRENRSQSDGLKSDFVTLFPTPIIPLRRHTRNKRDACSSSAKITFSTYFFLFSSKYGSKLSFFPYISRIWSPRCSPILDSHLKWLLKVWNRFLSQCI